LNSNRKPRNLAASVRQRLYNLSKERQEDFQLVLTRYGLERTMYRLSRSRHSTQFILKGAMLFSLWSDSQYRATRDLDLLGHGSSDIARLEKVFQEIIATTVEKDGLEFLQQSVRCERIKEDQEYEGVRIHFEARLEQARIPIQVDVGFGDAISPAAEEVDYPTMLDFPKPHLLAYPREAVIAEKFQAMVALGIANTRIKDFFDIWLLARKFSFQGRVLAQAIKTTFARRQTPLPTDPPLALKGNFYEDQGKQTQWQAFIKRTRLQTEEKSLADVIILLRDFLMPPTSAMAKEESFEMNWPPSGPWG
jgi:hypothetical protein